MVDFNQNSYKSDKKFGGAINILLATLVIINSLVTNFSDWYTDKNPYFSSLTLPFDENDSEMKKSYSLRDVNTFLFKVHDFQWKTYSYEDIEPYINIEIFYYQKLYIDGLKVNKKQILDGVGTCTEKDFDTNPYERNFFDHYSKKKGQNLICFN